MAETDRYRQPGCQWIGISGGSTPQEKEQVEIALDKLESKYEIALSVMASELGWYSAPLVWL